MNAAHHYFVAIQPPPLPFIIPTLWAGEDHTEPAAIAPATTWCEEPQVVNTKITRRGKLTFALYAFDFNCPVGKSLVVRNGQTVLVPLRTVLHTDTVINTERINPDPVTRQTDVQINLANTMFRRGALEPEVFLHILTVHLGSWTQGDNSTPLAFLQTVRDRLVTGFSAPTKFAKTLRTEFIAYCVELYPGLLVRSIESDSYAELRNISGYLLEELAQRKIAERDGLSQPMVSKREDKAKTSTKGKVGK